MSLLPLELAQTLYYVVKPNWAYSQRGKSDPHHRRDRHWQDKDEYNRMVAEVKAWKKDKQEGQKDDSQQEGHKDDSAGGQEDEKEEEDAPETRDEPEKRKKKNKGRKRKQRGQERGYSTTRAVSRMEAFFGFFFRRARSPAPPCALPRRRRRLRWCPWFRERSSGPPPSCRISGCHRCPP